MYNTLLSKEDYESYPKNHEAFVNLMKIALLKGSFCLIGFSGDDPNFLEWINWVKDILDKNFETSKNSKRIYYIYPSDTVLEEDKKLLFENHYITPICLADIYPEQQEIKQQIKSFLTALANCTDKIENVWNRIDSITKIKGDFKHDWNQISQNDVKLLNESFDNNYSSINKDIDHTRTDLFSDIKKKIKEKKVTNKIASLLFNAVRIEHMPLESIVNYSTDKKGYSEITELTSQIHSLGDKVYNHMFKMLDIHSRSLLNSTVHLKDINPSNDDERYEYIYSLLLNLDIKKTQKEIQSWKPIDKKWIIKKFLIKSMADKIEIEDIQSIIENRNDNIEEYLLAVQIASRIGWQLLLKNKNVSAKIDKIISKSDPHEKNIAIYYDVIKTITEGIKENKDFKPYGDTSITYRFSHYDASKINSIRLIQFMSETGIPTTSLNFTFVDKGIWIQVFEKLFEDYPFPCLFYSLQYYSDKKLIKKISQEFIYSVRLKSIIPKILNTLLKTCTEKTTPNYLKEAIYVAAPYFMKCVHYTKWIKYFKQIVLTADYFTKPPQKNDIILNPIYNYICKGLSLIHDDAYINSVIINCLNRFNNTTDYDSNIIEVCLNNIKRLSA
ncbi:MAG: SIR2 family protein, partial [Bacteroidales bacterium]|nr:SIR2 family protein [Bacteroidales bacterium]